MSKLKHNRTSQGELEVLAFEGELDLANAKAARGVILGALDQSLRLGLDLSAVAYIDSSGIANLIEAFHKARSSGKWFRITAASQPVMMVLKMARLESILLA